MGFFSKIKQSMDNSAAASKERAAQRAEAEAKRAAAANERNEAEKGYGQRERADEYWAVIDRSGSTLTGELPDIKNSKVYAAMNDEDLENKLSEFLNAAVEQSKRLSQPLPPKSKYFEIRDRYPGKEVFRVDSEAIQELLGIADDEFHTRRSRRGGHGGGHGGRGYGGDIGNTQPYIDPQVLQPTGYFAVIEIRGATVYGEVPGFTMMRSVGRASVDECVQDLTKQLSDNLRHMTPSRWPPKKTYAELEKLHLTAMSTKTIIQIIAQV
jgi:hypothetical protein